MSAGEAVLITGGAGYIGSHAVLTFQDCGYPVIVLDDLSTGVRDNVPSDVPFVCADVADEALVESLIREHRVGRVVHFAGSVVVPESVADPLKYYGNNTCATRSLLAACVRSGVRSLVFSSTAAVYGQPRSIPVGEDAIPRPANPYGWSKLMIEQILRDTAVAHDLRYVALRYFNVAGADPQGRTGQSTPRATHLIKVACEAAAGARPFVEVFGEDYDTSDGTCIRDYIHVSDLVAAHVDALRHLAAGGESLVLNCGYGHGYSVRQVLETVQKVAARPIDIRSAPRRPGDPAALVADASRIRSRFDWRPAFDDLDSIVRTALLWETRLQARNTQWTGP